MKIVAKSKGYPTNTTPTLLRELDYIPPKDVKLRPEIVVIKIGGESKSSFINALYQAHGKMARPANVINLMKRKRGTLQYRVYTTGTPLSSDLSRPFVFIDTKGELFDVKYKPSMLKLEQLCGGLVNFTNLDNIDALKPNVAVLTINARSIVSVTYKPNWALSWFYSTSYTVDPLQGYLELKKEIERLLGRDRSCYLLFTHIDLLQKDEYSALKQQLQQHNISDVDVIFAAKTCREIDVTCDHWSNETLNNYCRFLANLDVSY